MKKYTWVVFALLISAVLTIMISNEAWAGWTSIKTIRGAGEEMTSKPFEIDREKWRIKYAHYNEGSLYVYVYKQLEEDDEIDDYEWIDTPVNSTKPDKDESDDIEGPGNFYIKVNSTSPRWTVDVEEYR